MIGDYWFNLVSAEHYCMIRRKIEIAEWKLGIYNPYSQIDYVDFEDNPHYFLWFNQIDKRIKVYNAARRLGKPTFSEIYFKQDIRSKYGIKSN